MDLIVKQVRTRGNKFGICAGKSVLRRFKTSDDAQKELDKNKGFYKYWSKSASVSVDNSKIR